MQDLCTLKEEERKEGKGISKCFSPKQMVTRVSQEEHHPAEAFGHA